MLSYVIEPGVGWKHGNREEVKNVPMRRLDIIPRPLDTTIRFVRSDLCRSLLVRFHRLLVSISCCWTIVVFYTQQCRYGSLDGLCPENHA